MAVIESKRSSRRMQPAKPNTIKRRKTASRRSRRNLTRGFYRFKDVKGKPLDFVEVYTSGEYHCIEVRFQDKTALNFVIDLGFTLETDYSDWKTGNWRPIKRWPLIRSAT